MEKRDELWEIEKRSGSYLLGRKETLVELVLTVLDVRGLVVDPINEARIRAERALPTLERWAVAVREVGRVSELFDLQ